MIIVIFLSKTFLSIIRIRISNGHFRFFFFRFSSFLSAAKLPNAPRPTVDVLAPATKNMTIEATVGNLPASSDYENLKDEQHGLLQNHRGVAARDGWNHASLYSQSLRHFVENIRKRVYDPQDLAFADEYSRAFSEKEILTGEDVSDLMSTLLGVGEPTGTLNVMGLLGIDIGPKTIERGGGKGEVRCDCAVELGVTVKGQEARIVVVLGEAKGKAGGLDLANGQNQLSHVFLCFQPSDLAKEIRAKTCCPVIFIEQEGSVLCVSIGAFIGDKFLKHHVACIKVECSTFNVDHMAEQASIWHAIRKAVPELKQEYQRLLDERKDVEVDFLNDKVRIDEEWKRVHLFCFLSFVRS